MRRDIRGYLLGIGESPPEFLRGRRGWGLGARSVNVPPQKTRRRIFLRPRAGLEVMGGVLGGCPHVPQYSRPYDVKSSVFGGMFLMAFAVKPPVNRTLFLIGVPLESFIHRAKPGSSVLRASRHWVLLRQSVYCAVASPYRRSIARRDRFSPVYGIEVPFLIGLAPVNNPRPAAVTLLVFTRRLSCLSACRQHFRPRAVRNLHR